MTPYPPQSPFKKKNIRAIASGACYVEIVRLAIARWQKEYPDDNYWYNTALERRIDKRSFEDRTKSYDKMLMGIMIGENNLKIINRKFKTTSVKFWRDLPLWGLLTHHRDKTAYIKEAYKLSERLISEYVFEPGLLYCCKKTMKPSQVNKTFIKKIARRKDLSALILLTAWAVESKEARMLDLSYSCALEIKKRFPHIICHTPHLFIQWRLLTEVYMQRIWSISFDSGKKRMWIDSSLIDKEIYAKEKRARLKNIQLPPEALMKRVGKKFPGPFDKNWLYAEENDYFPGIEFEDIK